jgi:hypothetical protein
MSPWAEPALSIDPVSGAIAVLALIVSVWVGLRQNTLQGRLLNLETARERDRLAQAKRAQLRASIVQGDAHSYYLAIENQGASEARAVTVHLDGKTLEEHDRVAVKAGEVARTLGPGVGVRYILAIAFGTPPIFDVALSWEDDTGEPGHWRSQLRWHGA